MQEEQEEYPRFYYPSEELRLSDNQLELAAGLSSSHAIGEIEPVPVDREEHGAQGAWRMDSQPIQPEGLEFIAHEVYPRSDEPLEALRTGKQSDRIHQIGELVTGGNTVVNAIPHSSISDIGLAHGLPVIALREAGYKFRSAMIVSQGVTMLGREYHGRLVPIPEYLGYMCDIVWFVYPNTDKTAESDLAKEVTTEMLKEPNGLVKVDMDTEQSEGGLFITSAVNATSYMRGRNGEHLLAGFTPGAVGTMTHGNTWTQTTIAELMGRDEPILDFCGEPVNITTADQAHDVVGLGMAENLKLAMPGEDFVYVDPRRGLRPEDFQQA